MYKNRLEIIGFVGEEPETKYTPNGNPYAQFSVATKTSWKDSASGEWKSQTEWHRVIVWGEKQAEFAAKLPKGAHVEVEGELRSRTYDKDGIKHHVWECKAHRILKLDRPNKNGKTGPANTDPTGADASADEPVDFREFASEDVPF